MGKASSNKKVARAARAGGKGKASAASASWLWPVSIGVVVVLGVVLIVLSRSGGDDAGAESPTFQDHWHEAYGVFICDAYITQFPDNAVISGIHTHNDGLVHIEPRSTDDTGANATFGRFAEGVQLEVTEDSITLPDGTTYTNGDECDGEPAEVSVLRDGEVYTGDPNDIRIKDLGNIAIVFAPPGTEIPPVPFIGNLDDPNAGEGGGAPAVTLPGGSTTTSTTSATGGATSSTSSTAPGTSTSTTAAGG